MTARFRGGFALAVLAVACRDPDGPGAQRVSGTYALRSINGSLPFTVGGGLGIRTDIVGGRIRVVDHQTVEDVLYVQTFSTTGPLAPAEADSATYTYRALHDTMFIARPAPYTPDSYQDTAVLHGADSITVWRRLAKIGGYRPPARFYVAYEKR